MQNILCMPALVCANVLWYDILQKSGKKMKTFYR